MYHIDKGLYKHQHVFIPTGNHIVLNLYHTLMVFNTERKLFNWLTGIINNSLLGNHQTTSSIIFKICYFFYQIEIPSKEMKVSFETIEISIHKLQDYSNKLPTCFTPKFVSETIE